MDILEVHVFSQEIRTGARPTLRASACAVVRNPRAGQPASDDLEEFVAASVQIGEMLAPRALGALGGVRPLAYGKGVLVGAGGDLEQGAAMIHCRIGLAMRSAIKAGAALIPGNAKLAGPGSTLDIVLGGIDDAWNYDAMDTMEIRVPGAPRADEMVLAVAFATGRPGARIKGASEATVRALVGKLRSSS
jgi:Amino acid synthesis